MRTLRNIALLLLLGLLSSTASDSYSNPNSSNSKTGAGTSLRRPVAILTKGDRLLIGNRQSGTVSVIDTVSQKVVAEHPVAARLADLTSVPDSDALFVLDDQQNQLLRVELGTSSSIVADLPSSSVRLALSVQRHRIYINSKWTRQLTAIDLDGDFSRAVRTQKLSLPFASHEMLLLDNDRTLMVADAFGGRIAVIDAETLKLRGIRQLHGHNIRGLAVSTDKSSLFVSHQKFDPARISDYEDVHWGRLVTNAVEVFAIRDFLDDEFSANRPPPITQGWIDQFGGIGGASADPGAVVTGKDGLMAVCLSGTAEVAIRARGSVRRIPVGRRPAALAIHNGQLYVANRFDDSVSIVHIDSGAVVRSLWLGPDRRLSAAERGELLFFDAKLSHDGWMSCHSCHTDGHSAGLLVDTLGDSDYGAPKRIPSLLGTGKTGPWGWNGSMNSLEEQIRKSLATTMHGEPLHEDQVNDLAIYLKSLSPPPPPSLQSPDKIRRGAALFKVHGCSACHSPPHFTTADIYDVGLADEKGRRHFNPPSLRGVSQRSRLLHDGRAATLQDVLLKFRHQLEQPLSDDDAQSLLAYLRSL